MNLDKNDAESQSRLQKTKTAPRPVNSKPARFVHGNGVGLASEDNKTQRWSMREVLWYEYEQRLIFATSSR